MLREAIFALDDALGHIYMPEALSDLPEVIEDVCTEVWGQMWEEEDVDG